ncbi:MAG: DUF4215 domain-containing protein [Deltaproteobacteria bacterium]|nr:DUF4215 domain-containing protein [Deltaproteobacteria bacterium]
MKLNSMAWLGIAGLFTGFTALATACGTSDNTSNGSGDGICGNAIVEGEEQCDDGNSDDGDGCTNACTKGGATTSSGSNSMASGGSTCGNSKLDPGEECDDGNDVDTDTCKNNCTSNASKTCGNNMLDAGEECDDGNKVADDNCTNLCTNPKCGDGIIQPQAPYGEDCDDGINNETAGKCPKDCKNPSTSSTTSTTATVDPCMGKKIFNSVVSNATNPAMTGAGISSKWSYSGLEGLPAGTAMCEAVGADHVCTYEEVVKAEQAGELAALSPTMSYWLHRTTSVPNPVLNKACTADNECASPGTLPYCDPVLKVCAYKAGAGGRCNDWTYPTGHISDGEYFRVVNDAKGIVKGSLTYYIDGDTFYDGVSQDHLCNQSNKVGCAGGCASAGNRAILCCNPVCKK